MKYENIHAVTGAFGYSGKYIAQRLLAEGRSIITLTNPSEDSPLEHYAAKRGEVHRHRSAREKIGFLQCV